jgi:hypothetical protein
VDGGRTERVEKVSFVDRSSDIKIKDVDKGDGDRPTNNQISTQKKVEVIEKPKQHLCSADRMAYNWNTR